MGKSESQNRVEKMREEITSIDQFNAIGGTNGVTQLYQVSYPTAHKHYQALKAREQIAPDLAQDEPKGTSPSNPSSEVASEPHEPSRQEIEQFFTDVEPQPVLPIARSSEELLLQQVIDRITERATEKNRETIREWFVSYRMEVNDRIAYAVTTSDKLVHQLYLEFLDKVECGIITALNREVH